MVTKDGHIIKEGSVIYLYNTLYEVLEIKNDNVIRVRDTSNNIFYMLKSEVLESTYRGVLI